MNITQLLSILHLIQYLSILINLFCSCKKTSAFTLESTHDVLQAFEFISYSTLFQFFLCSIYMPECIESHRSSGSVVNPIVSSLNRSGTGESLNHPVLAGPLNLLKPTRSDGPHGDGDSTGSGTPSYHVILPEAEMCEAVHKACPLLVPFSRTGLAHGEEIPHVGPVQWPILLHPLPRFFHCSLYTPGCRQVKQFARHDSLFIH